MEDLVFEIVAGLVFVAAVADVVIDFVVFVAANSKVAAQAWAD